MKKIISKISIICFVFVFLIILAGSIVRMTGSGMGCPDWPKCFGYSIPPTNINKILWQKNRNYNLGQMILYENKFYTAKDNFTSTQVLDRSNWIEYTKHTYTEFNPKHTWIEFINRLVGALTGIPFLILFFITLWFIKRDGLNFLLAFLSLFLLGFEAWLGKIVVEGNLIPNQITYHMLGSIFILFLLIWLIVRNNAAISKNSVVKSEKLALIVFFIILFIQVVLGTQVREEVDFIHKNQLDLARSNWIQSIDNIIPKVHRSFTWMVGISFGLLIYLSKSWKNYSLILYFILFEVGVGITLYYFSMPAFAQPIHILVAIFLLCLSFYKILVTKVDKYVNKQG